MFIYPPFTFLGAKGQPLKLYFEIFLKITLQNDKYVTKALVIFDGEPFCAKMALKALSDCSEWIYNMLNQLKMMDDASLSLFEHDRT